MLSHSVMSNSLQPHGLQYTRLPCPSSFLRACSNSCPLIHWCCPTILTSVIPFSSCLKCFPASGSFLMSRLSESGGQSVGASVSASVLPVNMQSWFLIHQFYFWVFIWKKMKTFIWKEICTPTFFTALFTITRVQKQLEYP